MSSRRDYGYGLTAETFRKVCCAVLGNISNSFSKFTSFTLIKKYLFSKLIIARITQLTFTCSKSTIETIEKGVKYVQTYFTPFSTVCIVDFEQVNVSRE